MGASGQVTCPLTLPAAVPEIRGRAWHRGKGQGLREREKFGGQKRRVVGRELGQRGRGTREGWSWGKGPTCSQSPRVPKLGTEAVLCVSWASATQFPSACSSSLLTHSRNRDQPSLHYSTSQPCHRAPSGGHSVLHGLLVPAELVEWGWGSRTCWVGAE